MERLLCRTFGALPISSAYLGRRSFFALPQAGMWLGLWPAMRIAGENLSDCQKAFRIGRVPKLVLDSSNPSIPPLHRSDGDPCHRGRALGAGNDLRQTR